MQPSTRTTSKVHYESFRSFLEKEIVRNVKTKEPVYKGAKQEEVEIASI